MNSFALSSARTSLGRLQTKAAPRRAARRAVMLPKASLATEVLQLAAATPGTVDAPVWAIVGGAVVVTAGMLLLAQGLKPGVEAAEKMQARDKKKFSKK